MNKKISCIFLVILTIIGILLCTGQNDKGYAFLSLQEDSDEINKICSDRKRTNRELLNGLIFNDNEIYYNKKDSTFYYSLVDKDERAYEPLVSWNNKEVNIIFEEKSITDSSIENNDSIVFYAYNNKEYKQYRLICTKLPILSISTSDKLEVKDEMQDYDHKYKAYDMDLVLYDNSLDSRQRIAKYSGDIGVRGASSRLYEKRGFKLNVYSKEVEDNKQEVSSLLNLRDANEYVLYAGYNDTEKIRNVFSSYFWYIGCSKNNFAGVDNGFNYKYCELFINGDYRGLYALGYSIDDIQEGIIVDNTGNKQIENIYKKVSSVFVESDFDFENLSNNGYEIKSNNGKGSFEPLKILYQYMLSNNVDDLINIVDINNCIDMYLFVDLTQNVDCDRTTRFGTQQIYNTYITSKTFNDSFKMIYAPWDLDRTWGFNFDVYDLSYEDNLEMEYNIVYLLLKNNDSSIKEMIKKRYDELRKDKWSDNNIISILDEYEEDIFNSGAFARDKARWPESAYVEDGVKLSKFKEFVTNRLNYFDTYIEEITE